MIDLSHTIVPDMAQWPGDSQPLKIHRHSDHGPGSHRSSSLEFGCHVGTHIDVPLHFLAGQPGVQNLPLTSFVGSGRVVTCGDGSSAAPLGPETVAGLDLSFTDFVLFATGWEQHWGTDRYYSEWPSLSPELATILAASNLKGVGLDSPSLDTFKSSAAHDICAAAGMINIENLTNLAELPSAGFQLLVLPLKLAEAEASPVRAVGLLEME